MGKYSEAEQEFKKAIEIKPNMVQAYNNLGIVLTAQKRYDEAIKFYNRAIEIKPDYADTWYNLAATYSLMNDKEKAIRNLSKAIDIAKLKEKAKKDENFKNLWNDENFRKIVN
jgi:tetratricopeptide (TPR) repeat protein